MSGAGSSSGAGVSGAPAPSKKPKKTSEEKDAEDKERKAQQERVLSELGFSSPQRREMVKRLGLGAQETNAVPVDIPTKQELLAAAHLYVPSAAGGVSADTLFARSERVIVKHFDAYYSTLLARGTAKVSFPVAFKLVTDHAKSGAPAARENPGLPATSPAAFVLAWHYIVDRLDGLTLPSAWTTDAAKALKEFENKKPPASELKSSGEGKDAKDGKESKGDVKVGVPDVAGADPAAKLMSKIGDTGYDHAAFMAMLPSFGPKPGIMSIIAAGAAAAGGGWQKPLPGTGAAAAASSSSAASASDGSTAATEDVSEDDILRLEAEVKKLEAAKADQAAREGRLKRYQELKARQVQLTALTAMPLAQQQQPQPSAAGEPPHGQQQQQLQQQSPGVGTGTAPQQQQVSAGAGAVVFQVATSGAGTSATAGSNAAAGDASAAVGTATSLPSLPLFQVLKKTDDLVASPFYKEFTQYLLANKVDDKSVGLSDRKAPWLLVNIINQAGGRVEDWINAAIRSQLMRDQCDTAIDVISSALHLGHPKPTDPLVEKCARVVVAAWLADGVGGNIAVFQQAKAIYSPSGPSAAPQAEKRKFYEELKALHTAQQQLQQISGSYAGSGRKRNRNRGGGQQQQQQHQGAGAGGGAGASSRTAAEGAAPKIGWGRQHGGGGGSSAPSASA